MKGRPSSVELGAVTAIDPSTKPHSSGLPKKRRQVSVIETEAVEVINLGDADLMVEPKVHLPDTGQLEQEYCKDY